MHQCEWWHHEEPVARKPVPTSDVTVLGFVDDQEGVVAVGTALSGRPPHRSQRAGLPHWAPTSGNDAQTLLGIGMQDPGTW